MPTPLLTLSTLDDRPTIAIDGELYPLATPDAMPVLEWKGLKRWAFRLDELWKLDTFTPEDEAELTDVLQRMTAKLVEAPAEVLAKLSDLQRFQIYQAFVQAPQTTLRQFAAQHQAKMPKTGATSSPASRGSMAGRRRTGSRPRSGSSAPVS